MLVSLAALACAAPNAALGSDSTATLAYLRANLALVQAGQSHLSTSIAGYRGVLATVRRDCPLAAAGSPQNPESTDLSNEVIGAMVIAAGNPDRAAVRAYLAATAGLRWSSALVTRAVSQYRRNLTRLYKLGAPNVCGDIAAWKQTGWTRLPSSTVSFVSVFYPSWVALGLLPGGLGRFENAEARALARRAAGLEYQLTNAEAQAVETWSEIMERLELNP
jgi:hypothetical protein